jgi:hypothetical protein
MSPACDAIRNPFIGSECGEHGKVFVNKITAFTPLTVLQIVPKEWPFIADLNVPVEYETRSAADFDIRAGRVAGFDSVDEMLASLKTSPR